MLRYSYLPLVNSTAEPTRVTHLSRRGIPTTNQAQPQGLTGVVDAAVVAEAVEGATIAGRSIHSHQAHGSAHSNEIGRAIVVAAVAIAGSGV